MEFVFLSGSFHRCSRSLAILNEIEAYFEGHGTITPKLDVLPFYSEDFTENKPDVVTRFLNILERADGLVICSPEYNHSVPAVLKNAIDWASRPAFKSVLKDMPVTFITQAVSPVGGARAQAHLKLIFDSTLSIIQPCHEMMITQVHEIFDASMAIQDEKVLRRLERHCLDFIEFTHKHKSY